MTPVCRCGHPESTHFITRSGRSTYCTVWDPGRCPCERFTEGPS